MLQKDPTDFPTNFTQTDASALDAMYERNRARIREIDAVLGELEPTMTRLFGERDAFFTVTQRCAPQQNQCCTSDPPPPTPYPR
jgi:hypothetical protein